MFVQYYFHVNPSAFASGKEDAAETAMHQSAAEGAGGLPNRICKKKYDARRRFPFSILCASVVCRSEMPPSFSFCHVDMLRQMPKTRHNSHALQISAIEVHMSPIQLEISPNRVNWRYIQLNCRYLQLNCRYLQLNCRYLQLNCRYLQLNCRYLQLYCRYLQLNCRYLQIG